MRVIKLVGYISSCFLCNITYAESLKPDQVMQLSVSNKGITRISIEGDPIREMFIYPDNLQEHITLHKSGNLFIAGENLDQSLSITLITSRGDIQDLTVNTTAKPVGPIVFKPTNKSKEVDNKVIKAWLEDFGRGFIPTGFHRIICTEMDRFNENYQAKAGDCFDNSSFVITIFDLKNIASEIIEIDEKKFTRPGEGIYVLKSTLEPGEKTRIIIIKKKGI